jgi:hypothetical protein
MRSPPRSALAEWARCIRLATRGSTGRSPDGRRFLLGTSNGIFQGSLDTARLTRVLDVPSLATYTSTGHILYVSDAALVARRFDPATGRVVGAPRVLAEGVQYFAPTGGASFSSADTGAVARPPPARLDRARWAPPWLGCA